MSFFEDHEESMYEDLMVEHWFNERELDLDESYLKRTMKMIRKLNSLPNDEFCQYIIDNYNEYYNSVVLGFPAYDIAKDLAYHDFEPTYKQRLAIKNCIVIGTYGLKESDIVETWNEHFPENIYF